MNPYDMLIGKVVQFTKDAEDFECYAEANMRARIVNVDVSDGNKYIDPDERVIKVTVDYSEFDEYNQRFESSNYYDKNGVACLNAREANQYQPQETLYAGWYDKFPPGLYFRAVDDKVYHLAEAFRASGAKNYVEWLESQIEIPIDDSEIKPLPMVGLFSLLTPEQQKRALNSDGSEIIGPGV